MPVKPGFHYVIFIYKKWLKSGSILLAKIVKNQENDYYTSGVCHLITYIIHYTAHTHLQKKKQICQHTVVRHYFTKLPKHLQLVVQIGYQVVSWGAPNFWYSRYNVLLFQYQVYSMSLCWPVYCYFSIQSIACHCVDLFIVISVSSLYIDLFVISVSSL